MGTPWNQRTALAENTVAIIAEAPVNRGLRCHANILNRGDAVAQLRLHLGTSPVAGVADYIEYDADLLPKLPLRDWPIVLTPGQKLYARVNASNCNAVAWGELDPEDS